MAGEAAYTLKIRSGCAGGGKGALVQTEKTGTLSTLQDQTLFQPIVFDARGNGNGKTVPTITGDHESRVTDYTAIAVDLYNGAVTGSKAAALSCKNTGTTAGPQVAERKTYSEQTFSTYTDSGSDSSDSLSIKVNAMDHKWIDSWMPDKEAVLHPTLCTTNWIVQGDRTVLDCGTLVVDDLSFSACPDVLTIGAVARPNGTSFHEKNREQVWKNTSIKRIAETIAGRYGLECKMDAEDVSVALKEQDDNDSSFLQKICSTYGLILKTYRNKIWIFDREKYKKKDSVATVKPIDIVPGSLSWNTTLAGTYTGGEFTYSNQKKKVNIKVTIGTADRMLKLNQYASSEADAKRQLQAAIDNKNHSATTISFTTMGNLTYCATQCIDVEGYGKIDGKYYMDSVGHTMNKSGGFVTKVSASRVGG